MLGLQMAEISRVLKPGGVFVASTFLKAAAPLGTLRPLWIVVARSARLPDCCALLTECHRLCFERTIFSFSGALFGDENVRFLNRVSTLPGYLSIFASPDLRFGTTKVVRFLLFCYCFEGDLMYGNCSLTQPLPGLAKTIDGGTKVN